MLLLQDAAHSAQQAAHGAADAAHAAFHPVAPWLILLLPLLGFLLNGTLSVLAARRALPVLPPVGDPHYDHHPSEQEHHAHGDPAHPAEQDHAHAHDAHGHDDHGHDAHGHGGPKPFTHTLPSLIAPGVMLLAFAVAAYNWVQMYGFMHSTEHPAFEATRLWSWMPVGDLQVDVALLLDPLSMLMTLIITGVGFLIHVFSIGYMKEDPGYPRYMAYLNLFVFFMLILVLGSSYPLMFVGWEGVGLASYLLIGFWFKEKANADAGKKAFIVNRIGDFGFLMGMFLLWVHTRTLDFAPVEGSGGTSVFAEVARGIAAGGPLAYGGAVLTAAALFFFLGACGKSAQIPLFVWLPDAMAGPTPVSALIHAATMVTAGVYLVVRSSVIFTAAPAASLTVAVVGALTAIFAASIGLKQWDIKKVLAYSTVSQLGFMFAAVGMGAYVAGVFHLMTHAFFKACLFLGSGAVIHAMHGALHATHSHADPQDMRNMGGLKKHLPITFLTMAIATLAIAGVPPFAGFFSKDEIIGAAWLGAEGHSAFSKATWLGLSGRTVMGFVAGTLSIAAFMTAFYMGRMMIYTFFGHFRSGDTEERHLHEGGPTLTIPLLVLAALSTFGGFLNVEDVPIVKWFDFGQGAALHHWLHPVIAGSEEVVRAKVGAMGEAPHHAWPIILAIVIGIGGLALAYVLTSAKNRRIGTADTAPAYRNGVERALYNKWWIDEIYDRVVVRPVGALSRAQSGFDRTVIDGLVDFTGRMSQWIGLGAGRLQSGHVNTYAFMVIVGVLVVLGSFVF